MDVLIRELPLLLNIRLTPFISPIDAIAKSLAPSWIVAKKEIDVLGFPFEGESEQRVLLPLSGLNEVYGLPIGGAREPIPRRVPLPPINPHALSVIQVLNDRTNCFDTHDPDRLVSVVDGRSFLRLKLDLIAILSPRCIERTRS